MSGKHEPDDRCGGHHHGHGRHGARQPEAFDPARAALLDEPERFEYLPPARLIAMLDAPPGGVVVDFGAGTGAYALPLAEQRPDLTVIALDEQPRMLELLRAKPAAGRLRNLKPLHTDAIDTIKGAADRILVVNVLHELSDEATRQMIGLLKPGGAILIADWEASVERPVGPPREHTYTVVEAAKRLERFGLKAERLKPLRYHFVIRARPE
ncbi:MAG TPA: class I SAM-dependent methyltransferase [Candidatus Binataceae bacterium]|jgi:SAM-dependent methyltransferase|nr:class I SAM-dependent methyltransferase [Candidatus Binataceae bacterium]